MILLVRHGETLWNREGRVQGRADSALTELGERQAAAVAELVAGLVDASWRLVASPIGRARRTAGYVASATGLPLELDDHLAEIGCGAWEGRLHDELAREHPDTWRDQWLYGAPGGESWAEVDARSAAWLAGLPPEPERRVIAVSHGVWGRHLRGVYAGLDPATVRRLPIPQDAVFRLASGRIERVPAG